MFFYKFRGRLIHSLVQIQRTLQYSIKQLKNLHNLYQHHVHRMCKRLMLLYYTNTPCFH